MKLLFVKKQSIPRPKIVKTKGIKTPKDDSQQYIH